MAISHGASDLPLVRTVHYKVLAFALGYYLLAQTVQVVLRWTILPWAAALDESIVSDQHPLNYVRAVLVLTSMFVMVPGFLILSLSFYRERALLGLVAAVFFLFFCLFEVTYRSIELFQVTATWGAEYASAAPSARVELLPKFEIFYGAVEALYFPLLVSFLVASACLFFAAIGNPAHRLIAIGMGIHVLQQIARLTSYAGVEALNPALTATYFPIVVIVFGSALLWTFKRLRSP